MISPTHVLAIAIKTTAIISIILYLKVLSSMNDRFRSEEYLSSLMRAIHPDEVRDVIMFCGDYSSTLISSLVEQSNNLPPLMGIVNGIPKVIKWQETVSLIDCQSYLLNLESQQRSRESLFNILYFLTFARNIRIVLVFSEQNTREIRQGAIVRAIKLLSTAYLRNIGDRLDQQLNALIDKIANSIGIYISDADQNATFENYRQIFVSASQAEPLQQDGNNLIKTMFKSVLDNRRIFFQSPSDVLSGILQINPLVLSKKEKTLLMKHSLAPQKQNFLEGVEREITEKETVAMREMILRVSQARLKWEVNKIVDHFQMIGRQNLTQTPKLEENKTQIMVALLLFGDIVDLIEKTEQPRLRCSMFGQLLVKASRYAKIQRDPIAWSNSFINLGSFLNYVKRIFEIVPDSKYEQFERNEMVEMLKELLSNLIEFSGNQFQAWFAGLQSEIDSVEAAKKLRSTIESLGNAAQDCDKMMAKPSLQELAFKAEEYSIVFRIFLIEAKYLYFKKIKNHWFESEIIRFLIDLEEDVYKCSAHLLSSNPALAHDILKITYCYLGTRCLWKKKYLLANQMFEKGVAIHKLKQLQREWLGVMIFRTDKRELQLKDVVKCIQILAKTGSLEEAESWCYRFMEKLDQENTNSMLSTLKEIVDRGKQMHEDFVRDLEALVSQPNVVDRAIMSQIAEELQYR